MAPIRVYEHRQYKIPGKLGDSDFKPEYLKMLQDYHQTNDRYYSLVNNGVKFCEYVGVLKIGNLTIEVLPKMDGVYSNDNESEMWQSFLIKMLKASGMLVVEQTGFSSLTLKNNSILDLYMQLLLQETEYLKRTGLIKKYRKTEGNSFALKGSLLFGKNVKQNLTHAERFFVRYSVYDRDNIYNGIIQKALKLVNQIGNPSIAARAKATLVDFPECKEINVNEVTFSKLVYDRKTESYRKILNMSKLLLLNYHPDIKSGKEDVLALMFNMNKLWEKYVFKELRRQLSKKYSNEFLISEQVTNQFWKPKNGYMRLVRPDIVIYNSDSPRKAVIVLDTKWKNLSSNRPDDADLKQMLVYNLYNETINSALVYPSNENKSPISGTYQKSKGNCSLVFLPLVIHDQVLGIDLSGLIKFIESCTIEKLQ